VVGDAGPQEKLYLPQLTKGPAGAGGSRFPAAPIALMTLVLCIGAGSYARRRG
jgi:hypothetical protein